MGDDEGPSLAPRSVGVGDVIRDRFVLEAELGAGGMGRVFKALDLRRQEARDRHPHVAVKLLTQSFRQHPASFVALQREARRAQTLAHPNIISVFDFDRVGSLVYLIMEYLCGHTLNDILLQPGFSGLGFQNAMQIIGPVGQALTFAHDHGIVHSDLKPSNIFLTDDGRVKVIDFGIARAFRLPDAADGDATLFDASSLRAFSPLYASPELIDGDEADPRDDVFSLACITYELVSGKHPFGRRSAAIARSISHEPQKLVNLSRPQWGALRKGLSFSRAERTASVEGLLTGLNPRPRRTNRRPAGKNAWLPGAIRTAAAGRFFARLDPRTAAKHLRLPGAGRTAASGRFFARLDLRPAAKSLRRQTGETAANVGRVVVRLKPLLAGENLRLSAATIAVALAVVTGLWLAQPGRMTTPANLIGHDAGKEQVAPAAVETPDGEPAPPGGMVPAPDAPTDPSTTQSVAAIPQRIATR